jgi:UDP-GlcNAc:undecaprenyl-phosphate/decaprenyl-phosphate GlcNAc-1-phosphate transferase
MRDYVLTLLVTAAVTYMLTPLVRRLAGRIGAMKEPRDRDVHVAPVPLLGGLAMFGGLAAGLLVADQIPLLRDGAFKNTGMVSGLLLAGGMLVVIGFIDDRWGLSALTKGAGQVAAAAVLVATGTQLTWLPLPGGNTFDPTGNQATLLTILIVVATINAVNFIDGLDGLAAGIVAIAAVSFFLYYYSMTRVIDISSLAAPALASALLIGMCVGFLPHNFSPASIFMGDTGSMLLGLLLAYAPISSIPSLEPDLLASRINRYPEIMPLLLPAALLVIPYADLLLAVVRRTRAGRSPFAPDRKHLHHRLLDIGHSQRASVLIMYLWAAAFSGTVVWLSIQRTVQPKAADHHGEPVFVFIAITAAAVVALLLMSVPRLRSWGPRDRARAPAAAVAGITDPVGTTDQAAMELRPPAAAPVAAPASAEPQLVTAAAWSRTVALGAPVPPNGSYAPGPPNGSYAPGPPNGSPALASPGESHGPAAPARTEPALAEPALAEPAPAEPAPAELAPAELARTESGWTRPGWTEPSRTGSAWTTPDWPDVGPDPEWLRRPEPPTTGWTLGDRPRTERELLDFRSDSPLQAPAGAAEPTGPAQARPAQARPAHARPSAARSIIGTPPPAVLSPAPAPADDDADPRHGDPESAE